MGSPIVPQILEESSIMQHKRVVMKRKVDDLYLTIACLNIGFQKEISELDTLRDYTKNLMRNRDIEFLTGRNLFFRTLLERGIFTDTQDIINGGAMIHVEVLRFMSQYSRNLIGGSFPWNETGRINEYASSSDLYLNSGDNAIMKALSGMMSKDNSILNRDGGLSKYGLRALHMYLSPWGLKREYLITIRHAT